jgi:hypothetical protein
MTNSNTKKYKKSKSKSAKKRTLRARGRTNKNYQKLYADNRKRNNIIRNIRMGHSTFNRVGGGGGGGGASCESYVRKDGYSQSGGGGYISQFIGNPWTVSNNPNTGNYFAPSRLGVGTGNVPKFDDGQPLNNGARWPTQLGNQLPKLGEIKGGSAGGGKKRRLRGGGIFDDVKGLYNNIVSSATNFGSTLEGVKLAPSSNPNPWDQPIAKNT